MIFHAVGQERDRETGYGYLAKCVTDPIALVHLGAASADEEWLERAATILNVKSKSPEMYEWVGDLFADGVKLPAIAPVALMWYSFASGKAQEYGEDNRALLEKIGRFM
jgi:hypothetical protein